MAKRRTRKVEAALVKSEPACSVGPVTGSFSSPRPEQLWLFCHPSWWQRWLHPNFAKYRNDIPITGVFCVFVEGRKNDGPEHAAAVAEQCRELRITFAYGIRHSHQKKSEWGLPKSVGWQYSGFKRLEALGGVNVILDTEPYYIAGKRYHGIDDEVGIANATWPWRGLGPQRNLYVTPGHPFVHPMAILRHAQTGGAHVLALDQTSFNASQMRLEKRLVEHLGHRAGFWHSHGITYVPGFHLRHLRDDAMIDAAKYRQAWLLPQTRSPGSKTTDHPDDLPRFGTPEWNPTGK